MSHLTEVSFKNGQGMAGRVRRLKARHWRTLLAGLQLGATRIACPPFSEMRAAMRGSKGNGGFIQIGLGVFQSCSNASSPEPHAAAEPCKGVLAKASSSGTEGRGSLQQVEGMMLSRREW